MNQEPIIFRQGEENGIVVERDHFEHSIMLNQYQQAIDIFNRLWKQQSDVIDDLKKSSERNNDIWIDNKFSNIIAFCGDRGEGKSSCMASFATMLTDGEVRKAAYDAKRKILVEDKQTQEKKEGYHKLFNGLEDLLATDKIEWLDVIDPSFFDDQHNLLELLLGRICIKAQEKCKQNCEREGSNAYKHRQLMEQLQRVRKCISVMAPKKDKPLYDAIEEISDLAAGMQLKTELQTLFRCYLDFVGKECLLICIDDLDLNIAEGYEMAEMLRKYLINPYCIVLVSVKVEQLIDVIASAHRREAPMASEKNQQMALKYVAKLLPRGNRVSMPITTEFCERDLQIADRNGIIDNNEPIYTVKEKVVQTIFQKTGYVFYNTQHLSPIIPRNLRSLRHLLGLLCTLPDARDENWDDNETGREAFKDYFFGTWATRLAKEDAIFVQQLAQYDDLPTFNAFVVEHFAKRISQGKININIIEREWNYGRRSKSTEIEPEESDETTIPDNDYSDLYSKITNRINTSTNISLGDVMYILWFISTITVDADIQNLIFFIKTVYSMRLYACYNVISQGAEYLYPRTPDVTAEVHIHKSETLYEHVNQLQRLVNGGFFSYPQALFLPKNSKTKKYRDLNSLPFDKVIKLFRLYCDVALHDIEGYENHIEHLQLCEYLALCITRTTNNKEKDKIIGLNRTLKTPAYLGRFTSSAKYAVFDFLNPFYALCNIKYAYRRFDDIMLRGTNLCDFALDEEESILYKMLHNIRKGEHEEWLEHSLISDAVIRVIDVQWAIYDELLRTRNIHKNGDDSLMRAYKDIQDLQIKLYPRIATKRNGSTGNSDPYILKFEFINELVNALLNIGITDMEQLIDKYIDSAEEYLKGQNVYQENELNKDIEEVRDILTERLSHNNGSKLGARIAPIISKALAGGTPWQRKLTSNLFAVFNRENSYSNDDVMAKIDEITNIYNNTIK